MFCFLITYRMAKRKFYKRRPKKNMINKSIVKNMIKASQEVKWYQVAENELLTSQINVAVGGATFTPGYSWMECTPYIAGGSGLNQRVGDTILIDKIQIRYQVYDQGTSSISPTTVRCILFQPRGIVTDDLASVSGIDATKTVRQYMMEEQLLYPNAYINIGGVSSDSVWDSNSDRRPEAKPLFKVYYDGKHRLKGDTLSSQIQQRAFIHTVTFKRPLKFNYRTSGSNLQSLMSSQVMCMFLVDSGNQSGTAYGGLVEGLVSTGTNTGKRVNVAVKYFFRDA